MPEHTRTHTILIQVTADRKIRIKAAGTELTLAEVLTGVQMYQFYMLTNATKGTNQPIPGLDVRHVP